MYGTLRGALAGRKVPFDRESYAATVEGRIVGIGKTIRIKSIHMRYELTVPAESREATERALALHPQGCPAHQSVQGAGRERGGRARPGVPLSRVGGGEGRAGSGGMRATAAGRVAHRSRPGHPAPRPAGAGASPSWASREPGSGRRSDDRT